MHFEGLAMGVIVFLIIGIFHPVVIKVEYYFGKKVWPTFFVVGWIAEKYPHIIKKIEKYFLPAPIPNYAEGYIIEFSAILVAVAAQKWSKMRVLRFYKKLKKIEKIWYSAARPPFDARYNGRSYYNSCLLLSG